MLLAQSSVHRIPCEIESEMQPQIKEDTENAMAQASKQLYKKQESESSRELKMLSKEYQKLLDMRPELCREEDKQKSFGYWYEKNGYAKVNLNTLTALIGLVFLMFHPNNQVGTVVIAFSYSFMLMQSSAKYPIKCAIMRTAGIVLVDMLFHVLTIVLKNRISDADMKDVYLEVTSRQENIWFPEVAVVCGLGTLLQLRTVPVVFKLCHAIFMLTAALVYQRQSHAPQMCGAVSAAAGVATEFICRILTKCNTSSHLWQSVVSVFLLAVLVFLYYSNSQYPLMTVFVLVVCYMGGGIWKRVPALEATGKFAGFGVLYVAARLTAECIADGQKE